jgi:hypothetical protein
MRERYTSSGLESDHQTISVYTMPSQPAAPTVSSQTASSITVQITTVANLEYAFFYKQSGGSYTQAAYQTSGTFQRTGLPANSQYVFKVQARRQGSSEVSTESSE